MQYNVAQMCMVMEDFHDTSFYGVICLYLHMYRELLFYLALGN